MKKKPFYAQIKDLFFGLSLIALIVSCGSFKGSSYFNSDGIYFSEIVLDSLDINAISPYEAGIRHFKTMDKIREEVYSGKEYELVFEKKTRPNFNVNYFSSNID